MNLEFLLTFAGFFIALVACFVAFAAFMYSIIKDVKTELKEDIADVKTELKQDIADVRTELKQDIANVRTELNNVRTELKEEINNKIDGVNKELQEVKEAVIEVRSYVAFGRLHNKAGNE